LVSTPSTPVAAAGDEALVERVEALLRGHDQSNPLLDQHRLLAADLPLPGATPGTIIGPYKLLEQLGEGGMGLVFVAEQQQPIKRRVALKIIKPGMDSRQVVARFEAERQALALMDHHHIAKVFDAGMTESGRPYFVMELVRGVPITEYCDERRLSTQPRLELFVGVCQAVQHAHQKGVIHRDLKPTNVLVTQHDTVAVPKIIDFGIAKAVSQPLTERTLFTNFAQMIGTPLYMSPEQAEMNGLDVDTRSDVYSLGVMLYELLTGTTPFESDTLKKVGLDEMRRMIREEEPPAPSRRWSTLSAQDCSTISERRGVDGRRLGQVLRGELDWIVMKALEKDRDRRYESASAFAADVQRPVGRREGGLLVGTGGEIPLV
jgi:serine/threonine protein kinase